MSQNIRYPGLNDKQSVLFDAYGAYINELGASNTIGSNLVIFTKPIAYQNILLFIGNALKRIGSKRDEINFDLSLKAINSL